MAGTRKEWLRHLRGARGLEYALLAMALLVAVLVLLKNPGGANGTATVLEMRMERVLSAVEGAGAVRVMINESADGHVRGVLVVAEGASDIAVRLRLYQAVHAVLDVQNANIEVAVMKEANR